MIEVIQSDTFARWLSRLKDRRAVARINARLRRLSELGTFGDIKALREGICEMRIDHGPGYRLYLMKQGAVLVILLAGGDKSTQAADIDRAITIAREWRN